MGFSINVNYKSRASAMCSACRLGASYPKVRPNHPASLL